MNDINTLTHKKGIKHIIEFILIYSYLLFSSGFGFQNNNGTLALLILIFIPVCFIILYKRIIINQLFIAITFFIFSIVVFSHIIAQDSIKLSMITIIGYLSAIMFVLALKFEDFQEIYLRVMKVLVPFSILTYFASIIAPSFINIFPTIVSKYSGIYVHNLYFSFVRPHYSIFDIRNQSIFWEPGAYVTYLLLAFVFEIKREKPSQVFIFSIIIAMLSTFSAVGYLLLIFMAFIWLMTFRDKSKKVNRKKMIFLFLLVTFSTVVIIQVMPDYIFRTITVKIEGFITGNSDNESVRSRLDSIIYPFKAFIQAPLFGGGKSGLDGWIELIGHQNLTFTPINWFAKHGIFVGYAMMWGLWRTFKDTINSNKRINFLIVISTLIMISAQEYSENPSILILIFYGIFNVNGKIKNNRRCEIHENSEY